MFSSLLIANRGEIACRVIRTARKLGIRTIAVYSDADREALHVRMADEAVHIGGSAARDSYLSIDRIVTACKATGAEAVHPGYGFLSENPAFAQALADNGIIFVGPPASAIEAMGDKITSKKLAAAAGVSTVPGHMGLIADADEAVTIARQIGYPVMIKAAAGGGGKGMRIAWNDAEALEGFERSRSEAASSFGDDRIFIEKFVTDPRHIEIQVLGDQHGNIVSLGERECSIQRRNQKVIEEAPSPFLDEATRRAMGEQSVALARAVGYHSAGTVEFVVDRDANFYFLEMNTRLQVEHPVTELVTGLDLVELMLKVAAGEKLPFTQADVRRNGWAIESRIYAEDPYRNFLPSTGRITRYRPPAEVHEEDRCVRLDTGVFEGGEISTHYDPMVAKLVTWGPDRTAAIKAMEDALDRFEIEGVGNNMPFLQAVFGQQRFRDGNLSTGYIAEEFADGFSGVKPDEARRSELSALACFASHQIDKRAGRPVGARAVIVGGDRTDVSSLEAEGGIVLVDPTGEAVTVFSGWQASDRLIEATVNGRAVAARIDRATGGFRLRRRGMDVRAVVLEPRVADLIPLMPVKAAPDLSKFLLCPMPGQVKALLVGEGETVEDGQPLAIVEAMKMENVLKAEKRARVKTVRVKPGSVLAVDEVMMEFEPV